MSNAKKWLIALGLAFGAGALQEITEPKPSIKSALQHGGVNTLPVIVALNMTLQKSLQQQNGDEPPKAQAAAGGK